MSKKVLKFNKKDNGGSPEQFADKMIAKFGEKVDPGALAQILDGVHDFLGRFVIYPSEHARVAHVLWIGHTHAMDAWESTPRIAFLSP
jgi:cytochrome c-type biogenesis protein CcmH/NrfF